ncbi:MAG: hypothetical protein ABSH50_23480 [Bryobacteraceae bacterium]|jgi:hypothetical protein
MQEETAVWHPVTRVLFRMVFCYLGLYCVYTLNDLVGLMHYLITGNFTDSVFDPVLHKVVPWIAKHFLHLPYDITIFSNGSGDTTYDWVLVLCMFCAALVAAAVWSVLDRRRPNYARLHAWFRLAVRLLLACEMFLYGTDKAPPRQFGDMTIGRLVIPFGRLTPFRLLWGFMAASKGYTVFGGLAEILGGVLLLIPQTVSVGALVAAAVLANVFALNLFYDVPVKLFSLHLLLMAVFLAAPDLPRLFRLLVLNRATPAHPAIRLAQKTWINWAAPMAVLVLGAGMFCWLSVWSWRGYSKRQAELAVHPPYYGVWLVDEFAVSAPAGHSLFTDKLRTSIGLQPGEDRWKSLIFERSKGLTIQCANDALNYVNLELDAKTNRATLSDSDDPKWKALLNLEKTGPQTLDISGSVNECEIHAKARRMDETQFKLVSRGFHFINEHPY